MQKHVCLSILVRILLCCIWGGTRADEIENEAVETAALTTPIEMKWIAEVFTISGDEEPMNSACCIGTSACLVLVRQ
jgi:hypothetical protein